LPAWQALGSVFVSNQGEWAYWTPEGYYDASANGHTLFGWQINRGLQALPQFYRADQFRRKLERPDVLRQLLPAGSLEAGFRQAKLEAPGDSSTVLTTQISLTPTIDILSPRPGAEIEQESTPVRAKVTVPLAAKLNSARVFSNGVAAPQRQLVDEQVDA